jgi:uncharacterized protein (TIRG00374 family)
LRSRRRLHWSALGILIGLACFAVLLKQVDLRQSWRTLGNLNGPFLLVPLFVFLSNLPLRAWRWQRLFPSAVRPSYLSCFTMLGIGNMANFLLPGRVGDLTRCVFVGQDRSLANSSRALATLAVEKVLDGVALLGAVLLSVWALHPPHWVVALLQAAALLFGGTLVLLMGIRYRTFGLIEWVRKSLRVMHLLALEKKLDPLMTSFADGLTAIDSFGEMLIAMAATTAIWSTEIALIWGLAGALGLTIPFKSAMIATAVLGLGLMIPAAPGGLGTYELFGTEAFKLVGLEASSALALTVVIHAWVFVANVAIGLCLLAVSGLSLAQLRSRTDNDGEAPVSTPEPPIHRPI